MNQTIYLDNNATTALDPDVFEAMKPYLQSVGGNPSSRHGLGRYARRAIDCATQEIADALGAEADGIIFTCGATEANNLAILSTEVPSDSAVLVSPAEHPSALEPALALAKRGGTVDLLPLRTNGQVADITDLASSNCRLAVVQLANSETGCVQPIVEVAQALPDECRLHCDAAQAVGKIPVDFHHLGASSMTISSHKVHGPPGVGALLVRDPGRLKPVFMGGRQQGGRRPGTEPVALIVGMAKAVRIAVDHLDQHARQMQTQRDRFERSILAQIENVACNGNDAERLPNTSNLSFLGADIEALLIALDLAGVYCSAGTACASGSLEPSPTLKAMGVCGDRLRAAIRFSVSRFTTQDEVNQAVDRIARAVGEVRASPLSCRDTAS